MCNAERDFSTWTTLRQSPVYLFLCKHLPLGNSCTSSLLFYICLILSYLILGLWLGFRKATNHPLLTIKPPAVASGWKMAAVCLFMFCIEGDFSVRYRECQRKRGGILSRRVSRVTTCPLRKLRMLCIKMTGEWELGTIGSLGVYMENGHYSDSYFVRVFSLQVCCCLFSW